MVMCIHAVVYKAKIHSAPPPDQLRPSDRAWRPGAGGCALPPLWSVETHPPDALVGPSQTHRCGIFARGQRRSEEHTSELQSLRHVVCRLLLGKNTIAIERRARATGLADTSRQRPPSVGA